MQSALRLTVTVTGPSRSITATWKESPMGVFAYMATHHTLHHQLAGCGPNFRMEMGGGGTAQAVADHRLATAAFDEASRDAESQPTSSNVPVAAPTKHGREPTGWLQLDQDAASTWVRHLARQPGCLLQPLNSSKQKPTSSARRLSKSVVANGAAMFMSVDGTDGTAPEADGALMGGTPRAKGSEIRTSSSALVGGTPRAKASEPRTSSLVRGRSERGGFDVLSDIHGGGGSDEETGAMIELELQAVTGRADDAGVVLAQPVALTAADKSRAEAGTTTAAHLRSFSECASQLTTAAAVPPETDAVIKIQVSSRVVSSGQRTITDLHPVPIADVNYGICKQPSVAPKPSNGTTNAATAAAATSLAVQHLHAAQLNQEAMSCAAAVHVTAATAITTTADADADGAPTRQQEAADHIVFLKQLGCCWKQPCNSPLEKVGPHGGPPGAHHREEGPVRSRSLNRSQTSLTHAG